MKNRRSRTLLAFFMVLFLWGPRIVSAAPTTASANIFFPAIDESRYISVYGSQTLQKWQYRFGGYFNYANDPLEVGLAGVPRFSAIDHLMVMDIFGSAGMTDWFQIGLNVPVSFYVDFDGTAFGQPSTKSIEMGDVRVETKFRLLNIDQRHFGISVLPYATFPTGGSSAGDRYVGNNAITGGVKAIFDVDIKQRAQISLNLGYLARPRAVIVNTEQDDMFTYGLGVSVRAVKNWMDVIAEVYGGTNVTDFFARESELPLEVDAGLRFNLPKPEGLQITAGGGLGLTFGVGSPDFRAILGVSYLKPRRVDLPPPPVDENVARLEKKRIVITKKIHFEFDRAVIRPISFRILDAVVDIMKENSDIRKVRVEGHCDAKGSGAYNIKLSQRRSNAVRNYLISHGIEAGRLVAIGYGEAKPVATNDTAEGRAKNRRVEFTILEQEGVAPEANP